MIYNFILKIKIRKIAAAYKSEAPKVPHLNLNKIGSKQSLTKQGSLGKKNAMSERGLLKPGSMNNLEQQHLYVDPKNTHQAPKTTQRYIYLLIIIIMIIIN